MKVAFICAAGLLLFAPSAEARWPKVERARQAALNYWREWPAECDWVWALRTDLPDPYRGWASPGECRIYIDRAWYDQAGRKRDNWSFFCTLYIHEWGHIIGLPHSDDPGNIMYPKIAAIPTPEPCR